MSVKVWSKHSFVEFKKLLQQMTESEISLDPAMTEEAFEAAKEEASNNGGMTFLKLPFRKGDVVATHPVLTIMSRKCRMFSEQELLARRAKLSQIAISNPYSYNLEAASIELFTELLGDVPITLAPNESCKMDGFGVFTDENGVKKSIALQITAATSDEKHGCVDFGKTDVQMKDYVDLGIATAMLAMYRVPYDPKDKNNANDRYIDLSTPSTHQPYPFSF